MIQPTPDDIGRLVVYRERGQHLGRKIEEGVLTSFNEHCAFVRYLGCTSAATNYDDLEWAQSSDVVMPPVPSWLKRDQAKRPTPPPGASVKPWPQRFAFAYSLAREGFGRGRLHSLRSAWVAIRPWWLSPRGRAARRSGKKQ